MKACGWRIEYALMKAGLIDAMTTSGIVSDSSLDGLIDQPGPGAKNSDSGEEEGDGVSE